MRIRLFSLCAQKDLAQRKLEAKICDIIHGYASAEPEFEDFTTPQEMLPSLAQSLKNEALTVVAVEKPIYNKIKRKLLMAMGYTLEENEQIRQLLSSKENLDEKKKTSHSLFPSDATVFPTEDGMFSGFAVNKGEQAFLMLALDKNRLDSLLSDKVAPYLTATFGEPVTEDEEDISSGREKANYSNPLYRSVNLLKEANATVAFCANKQEAYIARTIESIGEGEDLFVFAPHVEDRGDIDVVSYSVQLARAAKNLSHTSLGAVISDPFDDENGRGVCISITDGEKALARRFYAEEGEDDESLILAAAEETISLLGQNAYGVLSENALKPTAELNEKVAEKKTVKRVLIAILIILVLCVGAGIAFKYLDTNKARPEETSATQPIITTTEKEEPVEVERKELLSHVVDLMVRNNGTRQVAKNDEAPEKFILNGEEVDAKKTLALIVQSVIDENDYLESDEWNAEALKAMVVITYTNLKYRDNKFDVSDVKLSDTADAAVLGAVDAVYGEYLTYGDDVIAAVYHPFSAGKTADAKTVYGTDVPYLVSVDAEADKDVKDYKSETSFGEAEINNAILKKTSVSLAEVSPDHSKWIAVEENDKAIDDKTGYVISVDTPAQKFSGYDFARFMNENNLKLNSACFTVRYNPQNLEFIFTCYGYGSGVGLSEYSAVKMIEEDDELTYEDLLKYFFSGVTLEKPDAEEEESTSGEPESTTARRTYTYSNSTPSTTRSSSSSSTTTTTAPAADTTTTTAPAVDTTTTTAAPEPEPAENDTEQGSEDDVY